MDTPLAPDTNYKKLVVVALLGTALIIASERSFKGNFPKPRIFVALVFIWLVLGFLAEFMPKLAAYFAGLIFVGVLLDSGPYVLQQFQKRLNAPSTLMRPV